jgi:hypothetical protein
MLQRLISTLRTYFLDVANIFLVNAPIGRPGAIARPFNLLVEQPS